VAEYGDFQALMSFISLLGIITTVISTTLIREFSVLAEKNSEEMSALRRRAIKFLFLFGFCLFVLIAFGSHFFSQIFKISESFILMVASVGFLYGFPLVVNRAILTGLQKFPELSLNSFLDALSRFVLIVFFVAFLPYKLFGASIALGFSGLVSFCYSFWQIKKLNLPKEKTKSKVSLKKIWRYGSMVLWFTIVSQFFYNFDMLFVKKMFDPESAGLYGALLTIGRIVYFIGGAVPLVMFPVLAGLKDDISQRKFVVLAKSLGLLSVLAVPSALFLTLFPEFVIKVIVGAKYLQLAEYLPVFSWVMLLFTMVLVVSQYFLALSQKTGLIALSFGAVLELVLLSLFHANFWFIIMDLLVVYLLTAMIMAIVCLLDYKRFIYVQKTACSEK